MKILHLTECMAGGVSTAVIGYAQNTPEHEHYLLANARRAHNGMVVIPPRVFKEFFPLPSKNYQALKRLAEVIEVLEPDLIHAHSSFAGVYSRLLRLVPRFHRFPVVYTPHGLAFSRKDISNSKRFAFRSAEKNLAPLTSVFAGCSTDESNRLRSIAPNRSHICVPNAIPEVRLKTFTPWQEHEDQVIGVLGRITPARDPQMIVEIANLLKHRQQLSGIKVVWIGDGPRDTKSQLVDAGVEVTGWIDASEVPKKLLELSVLVHTAKWDGFPMSVLEAINIGVPTIVSDIPALAECPEQARFSTAEEAVSRIQSLLRNPHIDGWENIRNLYNQQSQTEQLQRAYLTAAGSLEE